MKAIISQSKTYKVIDENDDFYYGQDGKGSIKLFSKSKYQVVDVREKKVPSNGKTQKEKAIESFNEKSNFDKIVSTILDINHYTNTITTSEMYKKSLYHMQGFLMQNEINGIALDICNSIIKYRKASEKQAYILANTLDENGYIVENL